jgi:hypothetical protein
VQVLFGAVDCTTQQAICSAHDVTGYPTFKYFNYYKNAQKYMGGREVTTSTMMMRMSMTTMAMLTIIMMEF